jgi:hypothetical protein
MKRYFSDVLLEFTHRTKRAVTKRTVRMYIYTNGEKPPRSNRIGSYLFHLSGTLGMESYSEKPAHA